MASKKTSGIDRIERPVLPFRDLLVDSVGDRRDQVRRHLDAVEFLEMTTDLAHRHAARIYRDDLVIEVGRTSLILGDQLRIEGPGPVARERQLLPMAEAG
jgi:hypothetical protein